MTRMARMGGANTDPDIPRDRAPGRSKNRLTPRRQDAKKLLKDRTPLGDFAPLCEENSGKCRFSGRKGEKPTTDDTDHTDFPKNTSPSVSSVKSVVVLGPIFRKMPGFGPKLVTPRREIAISGLKTGSLMLRTACFRSQTPFSSPQTGKLTGKVACAPPRPSTAFRRQSTAPAAPS